MTDRFTASEIHCLWATDRADRAFAEIAIIERLLPQLTSLRCLVVAPTRHSFRLRLAGILAKGKRRIEMERAWTEGQEILEAIGDVEIPTELKVRWGNPSFEIPKEAKEVDADLIVVAANSKLAIGSTRLGGTAKALIEDKARPPVLIARPFTNENLGPITVVFDSRVSFARSINLLLSWDLPREAPIYLTAFTATEGTQHGVLIPRPRESRTRELTQHVTGELARDGFARARKLLEHSGYHVHEVLDDLDMFEDAGELATVAGSWLVIVGQGTPRHSASRIAASVPCSVLITR